ncbi:ABC transporter ATP-binding protein [Neobacillus cucumis]|uniref:ABC transporter ATP-binding protein n=1 Tax=Neobacillus cucumis TaxID=1740721 RepID=UPI0028536696|nr:ABC transporter ATP-binding protein [Neobacillus cucumis]MDR4947529.1 ABC transporter ATP-binding protein [Neobacillus cucumis]
MPLEYAIEMTDIVKKFGEVTACDHVEFAIEKGEIHALLGENGAGKSTIMSILSGIYKADSGTIRIHGKVSSIRSPKEALQLGIGMVHQNFRLVETLTAIENIVLGEKNNIWRGSSWMNSKKKQLEEMAEMIGLPFPTTVPVWQLSVGERQRVEIVKTLYRGADIIIFDEPTSVLTPGEAEQLFLTMKELKQQGKTMIITTHKLKEVMAVADRISVMRKGKMISQLKKEQTTVQELAELMVGREVSREIPVPSIEKGRRILDVKNLVVRVEHDRKALDHLEFSIHEHEIVGIAGVAGNGQKELAEALTGIIPWDSGEVVFDNQRLIKPTIKSLIDKGIAHIPEDRMQSGLAGSLGIVDNLLFKTYRTNQRSKFAQLLAKKKNEEWARELVEAFDVRAPDLHSPVRQLSGGNQQKLLFAREIDQQPKLMIAVHPSQGLDVGAAEAVHQMLLNLRNFGSGVLLISEDLEEVIKLSDKILVMYNGKITGILTRSEANKEEIGQLMAGLSMKGGVVP